MNEAPYEWKVPQFWAQYLYTLEPSACRECCIRKSCHAQRWSKSVGWHVWVRPTDRQIYARMRLRRKYMGAYRWR